MLFCDFQYHLRWFRKVFCIDLSQQSKHLFSQVTFYIQHLTPSIFYQGESCQLFRLLTC